MYINCPPFLHGETIAKARTVLERSGARSLLCGRRKSEIESPFTRDRRRRHEKVETDWNEPASKTTRMTMFTSGHGLLQSSKQAPTREYLHVCHQKIHTHPPSLSLLSFCQAINTLYRSISENGVCPCTDI